jgi:hypothetical protein
MPERVAVRSYSTGFELDETPISEGGMWLNGREDGVDWADVVTKGGVAYGGETRMDVAERRAEQGNLDQSGDADDEGGAPLGDYDDPTAVLSGEWGRNQHGKGRIYSKNPTEEYFQEVQIRLRHTIRPNWCSGYEIFFRCLKNDASYAEIVRWNGPVGDWTSLQRHTGTEYGVQDGDQIEATIEGDMIKGFINGIEVISVTDGTFGTGAPGIGFNFGVGDTAADHGFTHFEAETYDD